jgi:hypothetical protein
LWRRRRRLRHYIRTEQVRPENRPSAVPVPDNSAGQFSNSWTTEMVLRAFVANDGSLALHPGEWRALFVASCGPTVAPDSHFHAARSAADPSDCLHRAAQNPRLSRSRRLARRHPYRAADRAWGRAKSRLRETGQPCRQMTAFPAVALSPDLEDGAAACLKDIFGAGLAAPLRGAE